MALTPGETVDRYEVVRVLGEGGMAVVYEVRHVELGSSHALKVVAIDRPAIAARLLREGQLQAALRHPHIVAVSDVIEVDGKPGLVMELVDGPDLADWLDAHPPLTDALRFTLADQILAAVAFAHDQGMIHRDLKPGNVLITHVEDQPWAKVADFGLAKLLDDDAGGNATRTGIPLGTPRYMAPEQIANAKGVDARADVFALGCILYELWCGRSAFEGDNLSEIFGSIAQGNYVDPSEVADLPASVAAAIRGALQPQADDRIASTAALRAVLRGELPGPAPARPRRTLRALGLGTGAAAFALIFSLAGASCVGLTWWTWGVSDPIEVIPVPVPIDPPADTPAPPAREVPRPDPGRDRDKGKDRDKDKDKGKGKGKGRKK